MKCPKCKAKMEVERCGKAPIGADPTHKPPAWIARCDECDATYVKTGRSALELIDSREGV